MDANYATAIGNGALSYNNGEGNTGIGINALTTNVSGVYNTAVGTILQLPM